MMCFKKYMLMFFRVSLSNCVILTMRYHEEPIKYDVFVEKVEIAHGCRSLSHDTILTIAIDMP